MVQLFLKIMLFFNGFSSTNGSRRDMFDAFLAKETPMKGTLT